MYAKNVGPQNFGTYSPYDNVYQRTIAYPLRANVLSVYQRTCQIFHTSAYIGAIRRSVTGPLSTV